MNDFIVSLMLLGALSGDGASMPFWATANQYGIMPQSSGSLALLQAGTQYDPASTFQWEWGVSAALTTDCFNPARFIPDEAYAAARWRCFDLEVGMKHRDQDFLAAEKELGTLSTTGGNMLWSGNARTLPGYTASLLPVSLPWTDGRVKIMGRLSDYLTCDNRYVTGTLVHNTAGAIRAELTRDRRLCFTFMLDHYSQWGGVCVETGVNTTNFGNYCRMLIGGQGTVESGYGLSDQVNVAGNHLGRIVFRMDYAGNGWKLTGQWDRPYEDKSGMFRFQNVPDGVYTAALSFDDKTGWVTDVLYEFQYTLWQGGTCERRPATWQEVDGHVRRLNLEEDGHWSLVVGGADNYFNNDSYNSGWTYYNRSMGNPLFYPCGSLEGTYDPDVMARGVENNRLRAHHFGLSGQLFRKLPYKLLLTCSQNYGKYASALYTGSVAEGMDWADVKALKAHNQFSGAFVLEIPCLRNSIKVLPALYWDHGSVLAHNVAATLGIRYTFPHIFE